MKTTARLQETRKAGGAQRGQEGWSRATCGSLGLGLRPHQVALHMSALSRVLGSVLSPGRTLKWAPNAPAWGQFERQPQQ